MKKVLFLLLFVFFVSGTPVIAGDVKLMEKEELNSLLGSDDLVLLDVRTGRDWSSSEFKIKGAIRAPSSKFSRWADSYPKDKTVVLYCA